MEELNLTKEQEQEVISRKLSLYVSDIPIYLKGYIQPEKVDEYARILDEYWKYIEEQHEEYKTSVPVSFIENLTETYIRPLINIEGEGIYRYIDELKALDVTSRAENVLENVDEFLGTITNGKIKTLINRDRMITDLFCGRIDYSKVKTYRGGVIAVSFKYVEGREDEEGALPLKSEKQILEDYISKGLFPFYAFRKLEVAKLSNEEIDEVGAEQMSIDIAPSPALSLGLLFNDVTEKVRACIEKFYPEIEEELPPIQTDLVEDLKELDIDSSVESITTTYLNKLPFPVDNTVATLTKKFTSGERLEIEVGKKVREYVMIDTSSLPSDLEGKISYTDLAIMGVLDAFWKQNIRIFTLPMLYRALTGNPKAKLNPKAEEKLRKDLDRLSSMKAETDISEVVNAYNISEEQVKYYKGSLLYIEEFRGEKKTINNQEVTSFYRLIREPILVLNAHLKNQIESISINLLAPPISMTERNIDLKYYLADRISRLKGSAKKKNPVMSRDVLFSSLYKEAGISKNNSSTKKQEARVREVVFLMLDFWKQEGWIEDYKVNKQGNIDNYSITIDVLPDR